MSGADKPSRSPIFIRSVMSRSGISFISGLLQPHSDILGGRIDLKQGQPRGDDLQPVGHWRWWSRRQRRLFQREAGALELLGYGSDGPPTASR